MELGINIMPLEGLLSLSLLVFCHQ